MHAERNALQSNVFPRLQRLCQAHAATFQAIDLRWGVSQEAQEERTVIKVCLGEIDRCVEATTSPNFLVLLGDRYGARLAPEGIPADDYSEIYNVLRATEEGARALALLDKYYSVDKNSVPPVRYLLPRSSESAANVCCKTDEKNLCAVLSSATDRAGFSPERRLPYVASATEQEIAYRGLLDGRCKKGAAFCFFRHVNDLPKDHRARDYLDLHEDGGGQDEDAYARLQDLKDRLRRQQPDSIHEYHAEWVEDGVSTEHLRQFCDDVYTCLAAAIERELSNVDGTESLLEELAAHREFRAERARVFIGRTEPLATIADYLRQAADHPLVIQGASGSGKSALIAEALNRYCGNADYLVYRFIGATPGSANIRSLLESLCRQLRRRYGDDEDTVPVDQRELVLDLRLQLAKATEAQPLVVVLDALDQLSTAHDAHRLTWLPDSLPSNVHFIVSTIPGDCLDVLKKRMPDSCFFQLMALPIEDGRQLIESWLKGVGRTLQRKQRADVLRAFEQAGGLPLYLRLAFEAARQWRSGASREALSSDIPGLVRAFFKRLSLASNHGGILVSRSLAYLAAGRNGLSEDELLDVLSRDPEVMSEFNSRSMHIPQDKRLPVVIWARLYFDLIPYLTERNADGTITLDFFHSQIREVIEADHLSGETSVKRHSSLATYFARNTQESKDLNRKRLKLRTYSELPYQQTLGELWKDLDATLTDFRFLQGKVIALGPQPLIEDYERPEELGLATKLRDTIKSDNHLNLIQEALELGVYVLRQDPTQLVAQLAGRLRSSRDARVQCLLSMAEHGAPRPTLCPQSSSLSPAGSGQLQILHGHMHRVRRVAVNADGRIAVSASADDTIGVWNTRTGEQLHAIRLEDAESRAIAVSADGRKVVSSDDEHLLIWDVDTGQRCKRIAGLPGLVRNLAIDAEASTAMFCIHSDMRNPYIVKYGGQYIWKKKDAKLQKLVGYRNWAKVLAYIEPLEDREMLEWSCTTEGKDFVAGFWGEIEFIADPSRLTWVWDLQTGQEKHRLEVPIHFDSFRPLQYGVGAVGLSRDGNVGISAGYHGIFVEWDLDKDCARQVIDYRSVDSFMGYPVWLVVSGDCKRAGFCEGQEIRIFDLNKKSEPCRLRSNGSELRTVALSGDGRTVLSATTENCSILVWDLDSGEECRRFAGHAYDVEDIVVSADGLTAVSASEDRTARVWKTNASEVHIAGHKAKVVAVAGNVDQNIVTSASWDGTLHLWDAETGKPRHHLQVIGDAVGEFRGDAIHWMGVKILISDNAETAGAFLNTNNSGTLRIWDLNTCQERLIRSDIETSSSQPGKPIRVISPDGSTAIVGGLEVLDIKSCRIRHRLENAHTEPMSVRTVSLGTSETTYYSPYSPLAISADLTTVFGGLGCSVHAWDLETGKQRWRLGSFQGWRNFLGSILRFRLGGHFEVKGVAVSADGRTAVSRGDLSVQVWDLKGGQFRFLFLPLRDGGSLVARTLWDVFKVFIRRYNLSGLGGEARFHSDRTNDSKEYKRIELTADGKLAACATFADGGLDSGNTVRLWNLESMTEQYCLKGHKGAILDLALSKTGDIVVSGSEDHTVRVWSTITGECLGTFFTEAPVTCVAAPGSDLFVGGCTNGAVHILRLLQ